MPLRRISAFLFIAAAAQAALAPSESRLLGWITADLLRAHVSFLASDALEGRDTPSRGLDAAAEYIASQFRRIGLKPAAGGSYFQTARMEAVRQTMEGFTLELRWSSGSFRVDPSRAAVMNGEALELAGAPVVRVAWQSAEDPLPPREAVEGRVVVLSAPSRGAAWAEKRRQLAALGPAVVIAAGPAFRPRTLLEERQEGGRRRTPLVLVSDPEFGRIAEKLDGTATATVRIPAPERQPVELKNVAAVLEGADPRLRHEYILLTAHYDHVGVGGEGGGDRIFNGANDNASGTATVLALAEAFARHGERPRRTLVFLLYFGEEKGLVGSRYYARHPLFPLEHTVANLNFEQMGRIDDNSGPRAGKLTASGFDYTTLGELLAAAGADTGVEAAKDGANSDAFFARSDNQALADAGVPAITVAVAWTFADYHRPGDEWERLDYANMERAVRTCAVAVWRAANAESAPAWIETNANAARYAEAARRLRATQ
ncbi:MAG: M20/M25/M40 family metallo-hydrolase [Bryobacteraceae bacterium]|nr:M20/M25/M40 family metallo-hydrolase [Bryobacteraceae bacterium]MCX7605094.1 M20/M25/M40 family metallo-hydrolase [Bryobacteraceae bacterium]